MFKDLLWSAIPVAVIVCTAMLAVAVASGPKPGTAKPVYVSDEARPDFTYVCDDATYEEWTRDMVYMYVEGVDTAIRFNHYSSTSNIRTYVAKSVKRDYTAWGAVYVSPPVGSKVVVSIKMIKVFNDATLPRMRSSYTHTCEVVDRPGNNV